MSIMEPVHLWMNGIITDDQFNDQLNGVSPLPIDLTEDLEPYLVDQTSGIEMVVLKADTPTLNGTIYPQEVLEEAFFLPDTEADAHKVVKDRTICVALNLKKMGTKRKVDSATTAIETETDRNLLLLNKLILDSPELEAIVVIDAHIRAAVKKKALTVEMPLRGCYLLPKTLVPLLDEQLVEFKAQREKLVATYVVAYPGRMAEAEQRLGKLFNAMDYLPVEKVSGAFRMEWSYPEPVRIAATLKDISTHIFNREIGKMGERCQEMLVQVESGLIDYMQDFVDKLIDSLSIKDDGKPKIFKGSTVKNFVEFLTQLPQMNITNNEKLTELGEKAKAIMDGVDPKILRKDLTVRQALQDKLKSLKEQDLSTMTEAKPERKFKFE